MELSLKMSLKNASAGPCEMCENGSGCYFDLISNVGHPEVPPSTHFRIPTKRYMGRVIRGSK